MDNFNGNVLQRSISKVFPNKITADITEIMFLIIMGMFAITLHAKLRIPMHLPGKQGIFFMLLLVFSRSLSKFSFASSLFCFSSSLLLFTNILGFDDPFIPLVYILLGILIDIIYKIFSRISTSVFLTGLLCGFCWTSIPILRTILGLIFGYPYLSLAGGLAYPMFSHFIFGAAGGLGGATIIFFLNKNRK
jgi:hypothetical protein